MKKKIFMSYSGIYDICFNFASTVLESIDHHVMQMFHCGYSVLCVSHFRLCGTCSEDMQAYAETKNNCKCCVVTVTKSQHKK